MKIDVEGFEAEVFAGGEKFFATNPNLKMIMEFAPSLHGEELLKWIIGRGQKIHEINRYGRTRLVVDPMSLMRHQTVDLFVTR